MTRRINSWHSVQYIFKDCKKRLGHSSRIILHKLPQCSLVNTENKLMTSFFNVFLTSAAFLERGLPVYVVTLSKGVFNSQYAYEKCVHGKGCGGWLGLIIKMINGNRAFWGLIERPVGACRPVKDHFFVFKIGEEPWLTSNTLKLYGSRQNDKISGRCITSCWTSEAFQQKIDYISNVMFILSVLYCSKFSS